MSQIFRVERTKNYTVMSNQHFKNKSLSLKAKGLLSLMLSLPDDWNYNMQGLASLSRDGIDSVRSAIKELEHHGYVQRNIVRNEYGMFTDTEYIIREVPLGQENDLALRSPLAICRNYLTLLKMHIFLNESCDCCSLRSQQLGQNPFHLL